MSTAIFSHHLSADSPPEFKATYYKDHVCIDDYLADEVDVNDCESEIDWSGDKWTEITVCNAESLPEVDASDDDDAATVASAGSLGMFASILLLLFGMANQM
jgi:hypothetical protein